MAEGYQKAGILPENEGGTGVTSVAKAMKDNGIVAFALRGSATPAEATATISFIANFAMLMFKRDNRYAVYLVDVWGQPVALHENNLQVTVVKSNNSRDITVTNTDTGAISGILVSMTENFKL